MKNKNNDSKKTTILILGVALIVLIAIGITFAIFNFSEKGLKENTIRTGKISMAYDSLTNGISITNAVPMSSNKNTTKEGEYFDFTVTSTIKGKTTVDYEVIAVKDGNLFTQENVAKCSTYREKDCNLVGDDKIRLYLEQSIGDSSNYENKNKSTSTGTFEIMEDAKPFTVTGSTNVGATTANAMRIASGTFKGNEKIYYRLRMWADESYVMDDVAREYSVKVNVYGKTN